MMNCTCGGSISYGYMCILLYVKFLGCYGVSWMYGQFWGVCLPWVYLHSSICETYWMYWCNRDLWSFGNRGVHLTLVYVHSAFTLHLFHTSAIVTVSYCYSSLIVHAQLEMNNNSMTH